MLNLDRVPAFSGAFSLSTPNLFKPRRPLFQGAGQDAFTRVNFGGNDTIDPYVMQVLRKNIEPQLLPDVLEALQKADIYYTLGTHWDREWFWIKERFVMRLRDVMDDLIERLPSGELPLFSMDGQTSPIEDYMELAQAGLRDSDPEIRRETREKLKTLKDLMRSGKLLFGPWYTQPDDFMVNGPGRRRNLKEGIDFARQMRALQKYVLYEPDQFGHPPGELAILADKFGFNGVQAFRGINSPKDVFWLGAPNGSKALMLFLSQGYSFIPLHRSDLSDEAKIIALAMYVRNAYQNNPAGKVFIPVGMDHFKAVSNEGLALLKKTLPTAKPVGYGEFMQKLAADIKEKKLDLDVRRDPMMSTNKDNVLRGVWSGRLDLKKWMRQMEHRLLYNMEPSMAFAQLMLQKPPKWKKWELKKVWKTLLKNQPHDTSCTTSTDPVGEVTKTRYQAIEQQSRVLWRESLRAISAEMAGPDQWVVFNNSSRPYTGVVKVKEADYPDIEDTYEGELVFHKKESPTRLTQLTSRKIEQENLYKHSMDANPRLKFKMVKRDGLLWAENIPPYGVKVISKTEKTLPEKAVRPVGNTGMDNGLVKVEINPDGTLNMLDHATGKRYRNLHRLTDRKDNGDAYTSAYVLGDKPVEPNLVSIEPVPHEEGPLRVSYLLTYQFPPNGTNNGMEVKTKVSLEAGSPQVQFETSYTNTAEQHKMQVIFPTDKPVNKVRVEGGFGIWEREHDPNYHETQMMPIPKNVGELPTNTGPIQRFIMANGQYLVTEGLTEYEVYKNDLKIALHRGFGDLSNDHTRARNNPAGPAYKVRSGQMKDPNGYTFRYAFQPEPATDAEAYHAAEVFYGITYGNSGLGKENAKPGAAEKSMIRWDNPRVVGTETKLADNGRGLVVALTNTSGKKETVRFQPGFPVKKIQKVDFAERVEGTLSRPELTLKPYDIQLVMFVTK